MPDFLEISAVPVEDLRGLMADAAAMKKARQGRPRGMADDDKPLAGILAALVFEKPSTRTRVSFDVGVRQLGGQTIVLSGSDMQLGHGESIGDTARVLSRYVDIAMIRTFGADTIAEFANSASIPVINGLTNSSHPCQVMADIMTFEELRGPVAGMRAAWLGPGSNVCNSFIEAAGQFGFDLVFSGPEELSPDPSCIRLARQQGRVIEHEPDPVAAVSGADLIVTDAWYSMHDSPGDKSRLRDLLQPYQVNDRIIAAAGRDVLFMHCLPAHRGEEVTSTVLDGLHSCVFDEAENRLHAQKAVLKWCLGV